MLFVSQVSRRECPAGMYSSWAFGVALCTAELPYILGQCLLFGTVSYWMISFEASAGLAFIQLIVLCQLVMQADADQVLFSAAGKFFWYVFIIYLSLCIQTFFGDSLSPTRKLRTY